MKSIGIHPPAELLIDVGKLERDSDERQVMTLDHDGKIRMDCSSPYAMASLVKLNDQFNIAFGNDAESFQSQTPVDPAMEEAQQIVGRALTEIRMHHVRALVGRFLSFIKRMMNPDPTSSICRLKIAEALEV